MPVIDAYAIPDRLLLGRKLTSRVPETDQKRQRKETEEILSRLRRQPGIILADEVGMGKTYVALAAAFCISTNSRRGPVIIMVPPNLIDKWEQDLRTFCELYLNEVTPICRHEAAPDAQAQAGAWRYGRARHSVELLKLLDDSVRDRCHVIFLAQGAMSRSQTDQWISLALIRETLRRHGGRQRLNKVRKQIHRFLGELLWSKWRQRATGLGNTIWERLLKKDPVEWKQVYNSSLRDGYDPLDDDPVPCAVAKAFARVDLRPFAEALEEMPVRARGDDQRLKERVAYARQILRDVERELWKKLLVTARWRSPLLVMDEAHHLKNPGTSLARQLQSTETDDDLKVGDGALAEAFDRMLFLTATPFQLGHHELIRVLERFGDVKWEEQALGEKADFDTKLQELSNGLTESQRTAIGLQRCWSRLRSEDVPAAGPDDKWWMGLLSTDRSELTHRQAALVEMYQQTLKWRKTSEECLRPWLIRHNKEELWAGTAIQRRRRLDGGSIANETAVGGIGIPKDQMLPFFLAARSVCKSGDDLLGEALSSSYEAFRYTRHEATAGKDECDDEQAPQESDWTHARWFLSEFDNSLAKRSGYVHPKMSATVQRVVDLWERGEKVLVFAFYRQTCRALRMHISKAIEERMNALARRRLAGAHQASDRAAVTRVIQSIQDRFFDNADAPGRKALDRALSSILSRYHVDLTRIGMGQEDQGKLLDVMRRFLRVQTSLIRFFPVHQAQDASFEPHLAVRSMLDSQDESKIPWRDKFQQFIQWLLRCSTNERTQYLSAAARTQTGGIRIRAAEQPEGEESNDTDFIALASVQEATGETSREKRTRLMRAFNTPFFPDVLVCSQVMGEGVDLQRYCRNVIHHDLDWNPSSIEQRTGRVDRLGCKAEAKQTICVYLPYMAGTADERQYRVMSDRERWFRIVMGQDGVAKLIPRDTQGVDWQLPKQLGQSLAFDLSL